LLRNDGEKSQRLGSAGVDKGVAVSLGAVVALSGDEAFLAVVVETSGLPTEYIDNLAVGLVAVVAYGTS
jgi:hypothetical protein